MTTPKLIDDIKNLEKHTVDYVKHTVDYVKHPVYADATGSVTKVITLDPAPSEYKNGMGISFRNAEGTTLTGAILIDVNNLGSKPMLKGNGSAVAGSALKAEAIYTVRYSALANGGTGAFISQGEGSDLTEEDMADLLTATNNIFNM